MNQWDRWQAEAEVELELIMLEVQQDLMDEESGNQTNVQEGNNPGEAGGGLDNNSGAPEGNNPTTTGG